MVFSVSDCHCVASSVGWNCFGTHDTGRRSLVAFCGHLSSCHRWWGKLVFRVHEWGVQIFKQCHASFKEDGTLVLSCVRESGFTFQGTTGFEKTMKVRKVTERNGYWVVYGDRRQWGVLPKEIPVKELLHM